MGKMTNHHMCPNPECSASWGLEEISFQECDECGWPNPSEDDEYNDDEYNDDDDVIIGYHCLGCGNDQDHDGSCDRCTAMALEAIYF